MKTIILALGLMSVAMAKAPIEKCIVNPDGHSNCLDERKPKEEQSYQKRMEEMSGYFCTNAEDAAKLWKDSGRE